MRTLALLAFAGLAASAAHRLQRAVDGARFESASTLRFVVPDANALKVGVMGYHTVAADLMWVRAVLAFVDIISLPQDDRSEGTFWLESMLESVTVLDPRWRTGYWYGGSMLRSLDDVDGSDAVFKRGAEALPLDPYFPFSLGMNAYLHHGDIGAAVEYLGQAAALPGAPKWYGAAAAGFLSRSGQTKTALEYVDREYESTSDPAIRESLLERRARLLHDYLAEELEQRRAAYRLKQGVDIASVGDLGPLPQDPLGGTWIVSPEGDIHSSVRDVVEGQDRLSKARSMVAAQRLGPRTVGRPGR